MVQSQNHSASRFPRLILPLAMAAAVALIAACYARYALGINLKPQDDEGYMLLSLGHYLAGGHLYTGVFTQYGPFYFFAQGLLFHLLDLPVSHDAGRLVTLLLWLLSAALGAGFVYRLTGGRLPAAAAALATVFLARVLANEPGHPQQWALVLLMLTACASVLRQRRALNLALLGAVGSALAFTKINVGVFYFAALAQTLICGFPPGRIRTLGTLLMLLYAAALPLILMRQYLSDWAAGYCLLAILAASAVFLIASRVAPPAAQPLRDLVYSAGGAVAAALAIAFESLRQGISLATLLEGVVLGPLKHPGVFYRPLVVPPLNLVWAALACAGIAAWFRFPARRPALADSVDTLRCAVGFCAIPLVAAYFQKSSWLLPLLPLSLIPVRDRGLPDSFARIFITCLAATQFLQNYPVAGSQQAIAAAPLLLWAFICIHDGAPGLQRVWRPLREPVLAGFLALGFSAVLLASFARGFPNPASRLRGSTSLHLAPAVESRYQTLAANLQANCDMLFTLPGMGSLNYWSGVPTPNGWNLTAWVRGFDLPHQQRILGLLQADPQSCAVYNRELDGFWGTSAQDLAASPLARYITSTMPKVFEDEGYEIRVHPHRTAPWSSR